LFALVGILSVTDRIEVSEGLRVLLVVETTRSVNKRFQHGGSFRLRAQIVVELGLPYSAIPDRLERTWR
jgi:hypothetical protein